MNRAFRTSYTATQNKPFTPHTDDVYPRVTLKEGVKQWIERPLLSKPEGPKLVSPIVRERDYTVEKKVD